MSKYENVTHAEYQKKKLEMLNDLGRTSGNCDGVSCNVCPLYKYNNGTNCYCNEFEMLYPEKAAKIVMEYELKVGWKSGWNACIDKIVNNTEE